MDADFLNELLKHEKFGELFNKVLSDEDQGDPETRIKKLVHFTGMVLDLIDIRLQAYAQLTNAHLPGGIPDIGVLDHVQRLYRQRIIDDLEESDGDDND